MSCLDATFTLTPQAPVYFQSSRNQAAVACWGSDILAYSPLDLTSLSASNRFYFDGASAADPTLNYSQWLTRHRSPYLEAFIDLRDIGGASKQLALIFGFELITLTAQVQIYSDAGLLHDETLTYGDNQLLIEVESLEQYMNLYFIHVGGYWFFKGLSGYVV
jgi:hypothetical protein